jgi:hypothetical protein
MHEGPCPVCFTPSRFNELEFETPRRLEMVCSRCGQYVIAPAARDAWLAEDGPLGPAGSEARDAASSWIQDNQERFNEEWAVLVSDDARSLAEGQAPSDLGREGRGGDELRT